jgi:protoheme IX farnesyltransferase
MTEVATEILDLSHPTAAARASSKLADYLELVRPRMNFLVIITTMVGFYLASPGSMNWLLLLHTLLGTMLTASSASALNQFIEREHDARMPRTRNRPLPARRMRPREALLFGIVSGVVGLAYLLLAVNALTALLGAITLISYVALYTPMKRMSSLNTIVGAVPGAIPPMMGVTAATGEISPAALALFGILLFWQLPHFLAIAILYRNDYLAGGFKMLPGESEVLARRQIVIWSIGLIPITLLPALLHMSGMIYATCAVLLGLAFLSFGISCATTRDRSDARKLFFASIIYLPILLAAMMVDRV